MEREAAGDYQERERESGAATCDATATLVNE